MLIDPSVLKRLWSFERPVVCWWNRKLIIFILDYIEREKGVTSIYLYRSILSTICLACFGKSSEVLPQNHYYNHGENSILASISTITWDRPVFDAAHIPISYIFFANFGINRIDLVFWMAGKRHWPQNPLYSFYIEFV